MAGSSRSVLAVNCGSSSVKVAVVDPDSGRRRASELVDVDDATHAEVLADVLGGLDDGLRSTVAGVGHRVVHGGHRFTESVVVDEEVRAALDEVAGLAPLHVPANLAGIDAAAAALPGLPQVAVFDTGFHATLPERAFRYAVPQSWHDEHGARRFGFHGISVRYVSERAATLLGRPLRDLRLVCAHLGNGCSATAVRDGISVDTTMGFTPLEGLVMGTRSGDVDPGLLGYLAPRLGLDLADIVEVLNKGSGLAGVSGVGHDVRAVVAAAQAGAAPARLALELFVYRLAKAVAALSVPLGRLDALVLTGGIGENSVEVRERLMTELELLGIAPDPVANAVHGRDTSGRVSAGGGRGSTAPAVLVVPTDEELVVARDTAALLRR